MDGREDGWMDGKGNGWMRAADGWAFDDGGGSRIHAGRVFVVLVVGIVVIAKSKGGKGMGVVVVVIRLLGKKKVKKSYFEIKTWPTLFYAA